MRHAYQNSFLTIKTIISKLLNIESNLEKNWKNSKVCIIQALQKYAYKFSDNRNLYIVYPILAFITHEIDHYFISFLKICVKGKAEVSDWFIFLVSTS